MGDGFDYEVGAPGSVTDALLSLALFVLIVIPLSWLLNRWAERPRGETAWKRIRYGWPTAMLALAGLSTLGMALFAEADELVPGEIVLEVLLIFAIFPGMYLLMWFLALVGAIFDIPPINDEWLLSFVIAIATWHSWYVILWLLERRAKSKIPTVLDLRSSTSVEESLPGRGQD